MKQRPGRFQQNAMSEHLSFRRRIVLASVFFLLMFAVLVFQYANLQIFKYEKLSRKAEENSTTMVPSQPKRGKILDRNGYVFALDTMGFSLEITPEQIERKPGQSQKDALTETIERISQIIPIEPGDIKKFNNLRQSVSQYTSIPIRSSLTEEQMAMFAAQEHMFKGVSVQQRSYRHYTSGKMGAHVVGYVGRINKKDVEELKKENKFQLYEGATHKGQKGVESQYENVLRGSSGFESIRVSASGQRIKELGSEEATSGMDVQLTLDAMVQTEAEKGFAGRKGALVALDPRTGEILALVSSPSFDPNAFIDGISQADWAELNDSPDHPLLNRSIMSSYSPGSTFKPFMALAALHSGVRSRDEVIHDGGIYLFGKHRFRDSTGGRGHGAVNMFKSIAVSSDVYYYDLANKMGVDLMHDELSRFGLGQLTGVDLEYEKKGILPSKAWKMNRFNKEWLPGETISLGIGQGYNEFTMLQMAQAVGAIANKGVIMRPHLFKSALDPLTHKELKQYNPEVVADLKIPPEDVDLVTKAMVEVNRSGTGKGVFSGLPQKVAGKTGTTQVVSIAQNASYKSTVKKDSQRDHSLYIAFYPAEKPEIAVACIVENGGFGAKAAAPLVNRTLEAWERSKSSGGLKNADNQLNPELSTQPEKPTQKTDKK